MKYKEYDVCEGCMRAIMLPESESPTANDIGELLAKMMPEGHYMLGSVRDFGLCERPMFGCDCCHRASDGSYYGLISGKD
jgi:hypothetical protein